MPRTYRPGRGLPFAVDFLFMNGTQNVMNAGPGKPDRDDSRIDAGVLAMIPDRTHKAQVLPQLVPTGRWLTEEILKHFHASREKTIRYMKNTPGLRMHVTESPLGQPLDAYEWLLFVWAHSKCHTEQIDEVKTDPGFPKD